MNYTTDLRFEMPVKISVSNSDIASIIASASYGIKYWADSFRWIDEQSACNNPLECWDDVFADGEGIYIHDAQDDREYAVTREDVERGIKMWAKDGYDEYGAVSQHELDVGKIDSVMADMIIQEAIFGRVIYG